MKRGSRIAAILGGYAAAFAAASLALYAHQARTRGPEVQASAGMAAFGDALLAAGVFGAVALVPTVFALRSMLRAPASRRVLLAAAAIAAVLVLLVLVMLGRSGPPRPS